MLPQASAHDSRPYLLIDLHISVIISIAFKGSASSPLQTSSLVLYSVDTYSEPPSSSILKNVISIKAGKAGKAIDLSKFEEA